MRRLPHLVTFVFVLCGLSVLPSAAAAAPPSNDARAAAQDVGSLPALVRGTTVEATLEEDEPFRTCGETKGTVWYAFTATRSREVLLALDAAGDMDASVELFERSRSQLAPLACAVTNRRGEATLDVDAEAGTSYLVRVAPLANSVEDTFTLRVVMPDEPASPPGDPLPAGGASGQVDRFANPDDAWAVRMQEGRTYRINLVTVGGGCVNVALYAPGDFGGAESSRLACDDHTVFTPPSSGRYTLLVRAPRASRARLPYRLRAGLAERDDSAPGIVLPDDRRVRGSLRGDELDALDLYRFTIARRSDLRLRLRTSRDFDLRLLSEGGRRIGCDCGSAGSKQLERRLRPGRYFVAIRARDGAHGGYVLSRLARTITRARMLADGSRRARVAPGATVALTLRVTPAVTGRATLVVERYDPLAGWLFVARHHPHVSGNGATVAFRPPSVGKWRVTGSFDGTRKASASQGGTARFTVVEPLTG
jgi:hypothetical protein